MNGTNNVTNSENQLTDFDLCLCLSELSINSQIKAAWESWEEREMTNHIFTLGLEEIDEDTNKKEKTGEGIFDAKFAPMHISLNVPNGKYGQVKVTLRFESGKVKYIPKTGKRNIKEEDIEGWQYSFITDIDKRLDQKILEAVDPDAYKKIKELERSLGITHIGDPAFTIEYLIMKFSHIDPMLSSDRDLVTPDNKEGKKVTPGARNIALQVLKELFSGKLNEFVLGTVARRPADSSVSSFPMTDLMFHVHTHPTVNTLDYLGMFSGHPLPADKNAARSKITKPWIPAEIFNGKQGSLSGVLIISRHSFMDEHLMKYIGTILNTQAIPAHDSTGNSFTWVYNNQNRIQQDLIIDPNEIPDAVIDQYGQPTRAALYAAKKVVPRLGDIRVSKTETWNIDMTVEPGTGNINIKGFIASTFDIDIYIGNPNQKGMIYERIGYMHGKGNKTFTSQIILHGITPKNSAHQPEPEKFSISPIISPLQFSQLNITENDLSGLINLQNFIEKGLQAIGLVGATTEELLNNIQADIVENLKKNIEGTLAKLHMNFKDYAFIPPGGGVFSYQSPHFSNGGDLYIDAIYFAP